MNVIDVSYRDFQSVPWEEKVVFYAEKVLNYLGKNNWEVSLVFCSDNFIKELNSSYRNKKEPTDVLSFCQEEEVHGNTPEMFYAGDIVISMDSVTVNANSFGVDREEELRRVIVHGILHLSGMDHRTNDASEPMLVEQEKILLSIKGERLF